MKKVMTMGALLAPLMVQTLDMGPVESTVETGDISTGLYLYYDASEWDTGNNQVDAAIGEVKRQGIFAKFAYGLHDDWEVIAKLGFQGFDTEGDEYVKAFDSSGDAFFGLFAGIIAPVSDRFNIVQKWTTPVNGAPQLV